MRSTDAIPREYIELQLLFADWLCSSDQRSFASAVLHGTNLFRRFGFGHPRTAQRHAGWRRFVDGLATRSDRVAQLDWADEFADRRTAARNRPGQPNRQATSHRDELRCGAFAAEVRGDVLRFHFSPTIGTGISPLHPDQLPIRRRELETVVRRVLDGSHEIRTVAGGSWLYATRSYRSLFPPDHVATARPRVELTQFQGLSSWGQFLDHHGGLKQDLAARFADQLQRTDTSTPSRAFPIPSQWVESPVSVFVDHFAR